MTDRELMEKAAKAAKVKIVGPIEKYIVQPHANEIGGFIVRNKFGGDSTWNPLSNDSDALRLAVKLRMSVQVNDLSIVVYLPQSDTGETPAPIHEYPGEEHEANHDICTRRAIVRAAAEIGKQMDSVSHL